MRSNSFLPKIFLGIGFIFLFLVITYQKPINEWWSLQTERLKIHSDNFFYQVEREGGRKRPLSLIQKETELKLYIGEPFRSFKYRDWAYFWDLIYGGFYKEITGSPDLPKKKRQLTFDEIAIELMSRYPQPFAFFRDTHWKVLFGVISSK